MRHIISSLSFLLLVLTSCQKRAVTETVPANNKQVSSSEAKTWLTAHTWQINEVIDPFTGTRYKRGVISDSKDFASVRYTFKEDSTLTGIDWFGTSVTNTFYMLQDNQKIQIISPTCTYVNDIISINASVFSYKSLDGSVFILGPASDGYPTDKDK